LLPFLTDLNNATMYDIVLASASPRRKDLLRTIGLNYFRVIPSSFAEDMSPASFKSPEEYCLATATKKAEDVILNSAAALESLEHRSAVSLLISSDTIVEIDGAVLEKPRDKTHAKTMLQLLSGRKHSVLSAVTIFQGVHGSDFSIRSKFVERSIVNFADLTESDIDAYVESGEPMDKSGSYGIQGLGSQFVTGIEGDYFNIVGFPIHRVSREIAQILN
ncbi:unnamed protein product, partial [Ectocarpus fasciculatus]